MEGKLVAFDGSTYEPIWSVKVPNSEAYSSLAPGFFTADSIPDFFVSYAIGQWPQLEWSKQVMVDGVSGKIAFIDSLGFYQTSSPVVIDLDGNGIRHLNSIGCSPLITDNSPFNVVELSNLVNIVVLL